MTPEEMTELIDLYVADALPDALSARVEDYLAVHPDAARDAATLRAAIVRLHQAPPERPDTWFTERLLDTLLREQSGAPLTAMGE
jgi:anti-sigma factor RsiW